MESIKLLRLNSGEDIICYVEDYGHDELYIHDAMVVIAKLNMKTGKQTVLLEHWLPVPIIKENATLIKASDVMLEMDPTDEFLQYYSNAVGVVKEVLESYSDEELPCDSEGEGKSQLTQEDMKLILEMTEVNPNRMH